MAEKIKKSGLATLTLVAKLIIVAVKEMIDTAIQNLKKALGSPLNYKGSVDNYEALPKEDQVKGDVYNVKAAFTIGAESFPAGTNVAWDGESWDPLGGNMADFLTGESFEEFGTTDVEQAVQAGIEAADAA